MEVPGPQPIWPGAALGTGAVNGLVSGVGFTLTKVGVGAAGGTPRKSSDPQIPFR